MQLRRVENDGSHVIGEFVDMSVESNSGAADGRATVTWPNAEVAARLNPLPNPNCSFMFQSCDSRIFELGARSPG